MATNINGLQVSGLASGLDTASIVKSLMAVESLPQTALKTKLSSATSLIAELQAMNASVAMVAATAKSAAAAGGLTAFTTTSSDPSITVTAGRTATAGSLQLSVDSVARAQVSVTPAAPDGSAPSNQLTIMVGSTATLVTAASNSFDSIVSAINASGAPVTATKVAVGTSGGVPLYRLQLTADTTGTAGAFSVYRGTSTAPADMYTASELIPVTTAANAAVTMWPGSAAAQQITSASNTFENLIGGVGVTVSATTTSPAKLTIARDSTVPATTAASLTGSLITLFSTIAAKTATTASSSGGTSNVQGGVFTGNQEIRQLKDSLIAAVTAPVGSGYGTSVSTIGIRLTKEGTITFDADRFATAMKDDPAGTTATLQAVAARVQTAAESASDPFDGYLTTRVSSQTTVKASLSSQIGDWDLRLTRIRASYEAQYAALESAISRLNAQSGYLTSQLSGLTTKFTE